MLFYISDFIPFFYMESPPSLHVPFFQTSHYNSYYCIIVFLAEKEIFLKTVQIVILSNQRGPLEANINSKHNSMTRANLQIRVTSFLN